MARFPVLMHTALDALDCRQLAEFYRVFLGLRYRPGDETPADGSVDDADWLVLLDESGQRVLAFSKVESLAHVVSVMKQAPGVPGAGAGARVTMHEPAVRRWIANN